MSSQLPFRRNGTKMQLLCSEDKQEATVILADASEISVDAAIPALLSSLDGDVALKDKRKGTE